MHEIKAFEVAVENCKQAEIVVDDVFREAISRVKSGGNISEGELLSFQSKITKSNLYGCEFLGAIVGKTDFSGSNLDATKLENWRPSKWQ